MPMKIAGQASRYLQTYAVLLADFAADRGWRFGVLVLLVCAAAVVYPLPFVLIGSLFLSAAGGARVFDLDLRIYHLSMAIDDALPGLVAFASAAFLLNYLVGRLVNGECLAWQSRLLWRLTAEVPAIAQPRRLLDIGGPAAPRNLAKRVQQSVKSGFLIGRLVDVGLKDAIVIVVSLAIMLVLDLRAVAAIAAVTLLFLPAYAYLLAGLATERNRHVSRLLHHLRSLAELFQKGVGARPAHRLDLAHLPASADEASTDLVGFQALQMNRIYGMNLIAGLHALGALYAVYLVEGGTLTALSPLHLSLFIVLLLLLRSVLSLVGLMSRLTRGYQGLALLRTFLRPRLKPTAAKGRSGAWLLEIDGAAKARHELAPGSLLLLAGPQLVSSLDLLPLANALHAPAGLAPSALSHVPLLAQGAAEALRTGRIEAGGAETITYGDGPRSPRLPLRQAPIDLSAAPALALSAAAFAEVMAAGLGETARQGRLLVVEATGAEDSFDGAALLAVSDGARIVAAGPPTEIAARFGEDLKRWRRKAARRAQIQDDEIEDEEV